MINERDPKVKINLYFGHPCIISPSPVKDTLQALLGRRLICLKIIQNAFDEDAEAIIEFLRSPDAIYEMFELEFSNTDYVIEALEAIKNRYSFRFGYIKTQELISEEAENLACKILSTHIDCRLRLNSNLKALKYRPEDDEELSYDIF